MERLQKEDDPELAELIRTAVANHKGASDKEIAEIVRRVTQGRAQILLLDQQIEEVARKIESTPGSEETRQQLLQTRKELESKRSVEMRNLREAMGIKPQLPFGKQATANLNAWVGLHVLEEQVLVFDALKGFSDYWAKARYKVVGLLPEKGALDYVQGRLQDKKSLPLRIDVHYRPETSSAAQVLRDKIASLATAANADMQTELRLQPINWTGSGVSTFFLREGKIVTLHPDPVKRPEGDNRFLDSGVVAPNDLEQHILWRLLRPGNVPLTFRIEYDEASSELARQVADTAKAVAKRLGIGELVDVAGALVEPVPGTAFLGRWQAVTQGEMQTIEVQPGGVCQVTMGKGTQALQAGANVGGTWLPLSKEILIDIKDKVEGQTRCVYRCSLNADDQLIVNRSRVWPQGSLHLHGPSETIFKKVQ